MSKLGRWIRYAILCFQLMAAAGLLLSAYASYLNPQTFSFFSCAGLGFPFLLAANLIFLIFWAFVYWRYALLQLLVFLCCMGPIQRFISFHSSADVPEKAIKVLTFNTQYLAMAQPHNKKHKNPILVYLQKSDADIICLQECSWGGGLSKKDIQKAMSKYKYQYFYQGPGGVYSGMACFSRFPILKSYKIKYESETNNSIAHHLKIGKDTVLLINNHLESNRMEPEDKAVYKTIVTHPKSGDYKGGGVKILKKLTKAAVIRSKQAEAVANVIRQFKGKNVIVCGDFNDTPYSYSYRKVRGDLKDAFVDSGNGLGISYHRSGMYYRIDHLLVSPHIKTYRSTVDRSITASDHYPLWSYLSW